jgi:hypothetical protein
MFNYLESQKDCGKIVVFIKCVSFSLQLLLGIQRIRPSPGLFVTFRNKPTFYGHELLARRPTPKLEDHPLSAVHE